jgi:uncharacterized protein YndB with AHSA1/START domain
VTTASDVPDLLASMKVEVSHRFAAPIDAVWQILSDVEQMAGLGPEHVAAIWEGDERGVGSRFDGTNKRGDMEWTMPCYITEWAPPHQLGWAVLDRDKPSSLWSYTLRAVPGGTEVVQTFEHGPNYSFIRLWAEESPEQAESIVQRRADTLRGDMTTTLANAERLLLKRSLADR